MHRSVARFAALAAALVAAAGCGGGSGAGTSGGPDGKGSEDAVAGVVRVGDKHLTHGKVEFHTAGGKVLRSVIQSDGTYRVRNAPAGPAKVVVESGDPPPMAAAGGGGGKAVKLVRVDFAAKYADPATTDLVYEVKPGRHQYDIVLAP
ncbi:MAG: hypothetical protein K2X82_13420 [Gemmataceae bacterium]|nr:hypothetical protein [Gemmataceae bacterium]